MGKLARLRGVMGFSVQYAVRRLVRAESRQTALAVAGVAIAVAMVLSVTSVAIGLTAPSTSGSGTYWIVPEDSASSVVTDVGQQQLGQVHRTTERIEQFDGVTAATPVLTTTAGVDRRDGRQYLFVIGVVPSNASGTGATAGRILGLSTTSLSPGDPNFANGSYDGPRTGEVVISEAAAEALAVTSGTSFSLATGATSANRTFHVTAVEQPRSPGVGQLPVAVVHLSELQEITGGTSADAADRIRVTVSEPTVVNRLAGLYPQTNVLSEAALRRQQLVDSRMTVAVAVAAFVVAVAIGGLFVATTMGFELAAEYRSRAVMRAIGFSRETLVAVVAVQTLLVCSLGGLLGVLLWLVVTGAINLGATSLLSTGAVAVVRPELALAGLGAAVVVGVLTLPYLLVVSQRTTASEALST